MNVRQLVDMICKIDGKKFVHTNLEQYFNSCSEEEKGVLLDIFIDSNNIHSAQVLLGFLFRNKVTFRHIDQTRNIFDLIRHSEVIDWLEHNIKGNIDSDNIDHFGVVNSNMIKPIEVVAQQPPPPAQQYIPRPRVSRGQAGKDPVIYTPPVQQPQIRIQPQLNNQPNQTPHRIRVNALHRQMQAQPPPPPAPQPPKQTIKTKLSFAAFDKMLEDARKNHK